MTADDVMETVRAFLADEILEDRSAMPAADTPLLEWGILTSLSTMRLVSFIAQRYGVTVPTEEVVGANFRDLASIAGLVISLSAAPAS
ncbi:acyl carrier protein [Nonomuraea sp. SBT364]|uniref:acyl carrier protein n=1 Tax=Nonomuraea sp. SBT364 TaxID=1580530 RepID=UPI00066A24C5|nr:phosphopantetheine-binding protein [Nonomuraea sp. SBT364]